MYKINGRHGPPDKILAARRPACVCPVVTAQWKRGGRPVLRSATWKPGSSGRAHNGPGAALAGGDRTLPGWSVTAISGDRAWLKTPKGQEVTVVAGERLKGVGAVRTVDSLRGVVTMSDGRVVR